MTPIVVDTESDNPFAIDIARWLGQREEVADLISLRCFANGEFCPQFINEEGGEPGQGLRGRSVVIVSTASGHLSRDALAMRTMLVARAAKDNGAERVVLVEPDLFYSAQDRGPRVDQGEVDFERDAWDYQKFDGQPFSCRLYAQLVGHAGVDAAVTVHNHSASVGNEFNRWLSEGYHNLSPAEVFADYVLRSDLVDVADEGQRLLICAPDKGALGFAREIRDRLGLPGSRLLAFAKERRGERSVQSTLAKLSEARFEDIAGRDVLIVDDMVRTGSTIMECCRRLRAGKPRRVVFGVTHFYSSHESRSVLADPLLDEIVTTNTVPTILNRDMQGRLRKKMVVIKLERWIARYLLELLQPGSLEPEVRYSVDMSSKNPRWR
ncbi:MAG: ribose-phosphate pyrophosphokinase-like domain-containing protein [Planctomycetes bacterium]|nr:ribose-phosphate pyrophosphokinase-like domain-containing protein [Planctomycetota bacterium]